MKPQRRVARANQYFVEWVWFFNCNFFRFYLSLTSLPFSFPMFFLYLFIFQHTSQNPGINGHVSQPPECLKQGCRGDVFLHCNPDYGQPRTTTTRPDGAIVVQDGGWCTVNIAFVPNESTSPDKNYTFQTKVGNPSPYKDGDVVDVWYNKGFFSKQFRKKSPVCDPNNPTDADVQRPSRVVGWIMLVLFGGYLAFRWLKMWLVSRFRWFAAFEGVGDIASLIKGGVSTNQGFRGMGF